MNYSEARKLYFDDLIDLELMCYKILHEIVFWYINRQGQKAFKNWEESVLKKFFICYDILSDSEDKSFSEWDLIAEIPYDEWSERIKNSLRFNLKSSSGVLSFRKVIFVLMDYIHGKRPLTKREWYNFGVNRSKLYKLKDVRNGLAHESRDAFFPDEYNNLIKSDLKTQLSNLEKWFKSYLAENYLESTKNSI